MVKNGQNFSPILRSLKLYDVLKKVGLVWTFESCDLMTSNLVTLLENGENLFSILSIQSDNLSLNAWHCFTWIFRKYRTQVGIPSLI